MNKEMLEEEIDSEKETELIAPEEKNKTLERVFEFVKKECNMKTALDVFREEDMPTPIIRDREYKEPIKALLIASNSSHVLYLDRKNKKIDMAREVICRVTGEPKMAFLWQFGVRDKKYVLGHYDDVEMDTDEYAVYTKVKEYMDEADRKRKLRRLFDSIMKETSK